MKYCVDMSTKPHTIRDESGNTVKGLIFKTEFPVRKDHTTGGTFYEIAGKPTFSMYIGDVEYTDVPTC